MPRWDRTGPMGEGPRTGWGLGRCGPPRADVIEYRPGYRFGEGRGFGRGRGWCRQGGWGRGPGFGGQAYYGYLDPVDEAGALEARVDVLKRELSSLEQRLSELEQR